jgi:hypothetical protein
MIHTLADLALLVGKIDTPLGTFRIGEDRPDMAGWWPIPRWNMVRDEPPPVPKGPFWLQFVMKAPDYTQKVACGCTRVHPQMCPLGEDRLNAGMYCAAKAPPKADPAEWRGRKWRISRYSTEREVVGTAFAAVMAAIEHEHRESFKYQGAAVFGPHIPLPALQAASYLEPDGRH